MADIGIPLFALRRQVASALDVIVQTARLPSGRRLIKGISEVQFDENSQNYRIQDIFSLHEEADGGEETAELVWTRTRPDTLVQLKSEGLLHLMALTKPMLEV